MGRSGKQRPAYRKDDIHKDATQGDDGIGRDIGGHQRQ